MYLFITSFPHSIRKHSNCKKRQQKFRETTWCRFVMLENILPMNRETTNTLQKTYKATFPIYAK